MLVVTLISKSVDTILLFYFVIFSLDFNGNKIDFL